MVDMTITHDPSMDAREPTEDDLETFRNLSENDEVKFFEWPVEPLTVLGWEEDSDFGEVAKVETEGSQSFLYEVNGNLWHYDPEAPGEANPYPVENLVKVE